MSSAKRVLSLLVSCSLLAALASCGAQPQQPKKQRYTSTYWDVFDTVTVLTGYADSKSEWENTAALVHDELVRYHALFDIYNTYDGLTNMAAVNGQAAAAPVQVDADLMALLQLGKEVYALTDGQCNVAGGAMLALWHDARAAAEADPEHAALPDAAALETAAQHCGMDDLQLDEAAGTVFFADPELRLDVGAIGKGFAVERAARAAEAAGVDSMLLNVGGNLRAIGQKPEGAWTAGLENPWPNETGEAATASYVAAVELLDGQCLVTSGDYQRFFTVDGENYAHLIDPDTLYPARYVNSVSVLCSDSGLGDALSTGLFCMPMEEGEALVEQLDGVEVCWMTPDRELHFTEGFSAQLLE